MLQISTAALPYPNQLLPLDNNLLQWFKERGISQATLLRNRVAMQMRYCRALGGAVVPQIAFPFYQNGVMVNVKYRALPKHFCQVKNGQQVFYGLDDVKVGDDDKAGPKVTQRYLMHSLPISVDCSSLVKDEQG